MTLKTNEHSVTKIIVLLGVIAAIVIAPKNEFFLPNFLYFWLPQGIIIGLLFVIKIDHRAIAGCAIIMTLHLIIYSLWISSPHNALAWLGYFFSIPGAFVGAFIFDITAKKLQYNSSMVVGIGSLVSTLIGVGVIQLWICCTIMYCGFKC